MLTPHVSQQISGSRMHRVSLPDPIGLAEPIRAGKCADTRDVPRRFRPFIEDVDDVMPDLIRCTIDVRRNPCIKGLFSDTPLTEPILFAFSCELLHLRPIFGRATDLWLFYVTNQLLDAASGIIGGDVFGRVSIRHNEQKNACALGITRNSTPTGLVGGLGQ